MPDETTNKPIRRIEVKPGSTNRLAQEGWTAIYEQCCGRIGRMGGSYDVSPIFYLRGSEVVRLDSVSGGPPIFDILDLNRKGESKLAYHVAEAAFWHKRERSGTGANAKVTDVKVDPPQKVIQIMLAFPRSHLSLPKLDGVVTAPVFTGKGEFHEKAGYHRDSRLFLRPAVRLPRPIPAQPSPEEVRGAVERLMGENGVFWDFPYTSRLSDLAHVLAASLQQFVRPLIQGPTPFFLIDKPVPGTGATTLGKAIARIATGSPIAPGPFNLNSDDLVKKLDAALLNNPPEVVFLDNIIKPLTDGPLCTAVTEPVWRGRILGFTKEASAPVRCLWIGTGNNPQMDGAMRRRTIRIRLDAGQSNPESRAFQRKNFDEWMVDQVPEFLWAGLVLCQAWVASGMPRPSPIKGDFPAWSSVMQGIFEVAGVKGFLENLGTMHEHLDDEAGDWKIFIRAWWDQHKAQDVKAGTLWELWQGIECGLDLGIGNERSQTTKMGKLLQGIHGKHFQIDGRGIRVEAGPVKENSKMWRLIRWDDFSDESAAITAGDETENAGEPSEKEQTNGDHDA